MYSLFKKKQNFKLINKTLTHFEFTLLNKIKKTKISKDADISFPVFFKGINNFTLNGLKIRKKRKLSHINQTITIQTKLSKQILYLTVNTQCPLIKIR